MSVKNHSKTYKQINGCVNKVLLNVRNQQKLCLYTRKKNDRMDIYISLSYFTLCCCLYWFWKEIQK